MGNSGGTDASGRSASHPPGHSDPHCADVGRSVAQVPPTLRDGRECYPCYDTPPGDGWGFIRADDEFPIQRAQKGIAALEPRTLTHFFGLVAQRKGSEPALRVERPCPPFVKGQGAPAEGEWKSWTWKEYYDEVRAVAQGFIRSGLGQHDAVAIYGFNAPEWLMAEMAGIMAGGVAAGVYPTDTPAQVKYKSEHSNAVVACVDTAAKAKMFVSLGLPKLRLVVVWGDDDVSGVAGADSVQVVSWKQLVADASPEQDAALEERIANQRPGHCCAYIYTSGTTGQPKAVMISHDNITFLTQSAVHMLPWMGNTDHGPERAQERVLSYLPLSHVAGMMCDIVLPIIVGALRQGTFCITFARAYDLKEGTLVDRLRNVRPTIFLGVPRVWEKIQEKMTATVAANPPTGMKLKVAQWAKQAGLEHQRNCQLSGSGSKSMLHGLYESKVYSTVKNRLGLDKCQFAFTGAAPISVDTLEYFGALGININEVYGMSESTGATTWSTDQAHQWGSCGWALPGVEVVCMRDKGDGTYEEVPRARDVRNPSEQEQGEICFRGRHIMMGYMANKDLGEEHVEEIRKKTSEAIDLKGWLHSGDKGCIGANGLVRITGRFKEIIIGAGGENIAPVPIENMVKKVQPAISNIMMVGDKRKFNVALVTLKAVGATGDAPGGDELAGEAASLVDGVTTIPQACQSKEFTDKICAAIVAANKDGSVCPSNAAKIQKFTILPRDFSVATAELTPTLKLKRSHVEKQHAELIDRIYGSSETYVPA